MMETVFDILSVTWIVCLAVLLVMAYRAPRDKFDEYDHGRQASDRDRRQSPAEQQRRSFAYGNSKIENSDITRDIIAREAERLDEAGMTDARMQR